MVRTHSSQKPCPVFIKRVKNDKSTLFELVGHKAGVQVVVDFPMLLMIQNAGHEIYDVDAMLLECARNN